MERICQFSPCRKYRYTLWREWDMTNKSYLMVIGLNPSTADETQDDPTIRRCIDFAKCWQFGALCMTNIFAWRETNPELMKKQSDPIGSDNDRWLKECSVDAGFVLAAWGKHGSHMARGAKVRQMIRAVHCLKLNKDGSPVHPLYQPANAQPFLMT